jgi:hypothetical protein
MDAASLVELLQAGEDSCAQFVQLLNQKLQDHNFKDVLKALSPAVCSQGRQVSTPAGAQQRKHHRKHMLLLVY